MLHIKQSDKAGVFIIVKSVNYVVRFFILFVGGIGNLAEFAEVRDHGGMLWSRSRSVASRRSVQCTSPLIPYASLWLTRFVSSYVSSAPHNVVRVLYTAAQFSWQ